MATVIKKEKNLTLRDRLSKLTLEDAVRLLGGDKLGKNQLYDSGRLPVENIDE